MIELVILREGEPIELIDGVLVRKDKSDSAGNPTIHDSKHAYYVQRLRNLDVLVKPHRDYIRQQLPITLSGNREPEPDLAFVRGTIDEYQGRHPGPSDYLAVIEVADHSLEYDQTVKLISTPMPRFHVTGSKTSGGHIEACEAPIAAEGRHA